MQLDNYRHRYSFRKYKAFPSSARTPILLQRLSFSVLPTTAKMHSITPLLALLLLPIASTKHLKHPCLTSTEAKDLATAWLHLWDTNAVSSLSDLTPILSPNITSYDEAYGGPLVGIEAFLETVTAPGNYTTTDV